MINKPTDIVAKVLQTSYGQRLVVEAEPSRDFDISAEYALFRELHRILSIQGEGKVTMSVRTYQFEKLSIPIHELPDEYKQIPMKSINGLVEEYAGSEAEQPFDLSKVPNAYKTKVMGLMLEAFEIEENQAETQPVTDSNSETDVHKEG